MRKILFLFLILSISISYSQTDGSLDTSFGTNGKISTDLAAGSTDFAYDGIQLSDNKILVGGYTTLNGTDNLLLKYLPNGQLDVSFGNNGISILEIGTNTSQIRKIGTQSDGKIIFAGRSGSSVSFATIGRANSNGTLDTTFGTNGFTKRISGSESDIQSLHILPDDKIIVVGYVLNNNPDIQVIKLNADGSYDNTFGTNGIAVINFESLSQRAFCSVMNGDKILIGGVVNNPNESSLLMQLNPNGSIDTSFGVNGYSYAQFGTNPYNRYDRFLSVKIFNNKIYGVGSRATDGFNNSINLAKFTINGLLDTSFSDDGKLLIDTSSEKDFINDLNILQDDSILLAGVTQSSSSTNFLLVKLNPDGSYKNNFGVNGIVKTQMNSNSTIQKVIVNELKFLVIGADNTFASSNIALAKYNNSNIKVNPTFTQVASICSGESLSPLPTTSVNGISGTWAPALNNTTTTEYTFTPSDGQSATITTMTIAVNEKVIPAFNQVAAICSGETLSALPIISNNGISGVWSPALNNNATTEYTFIPSTEQCASSAKMTIVINEKVTPSFTQVAAICSGETISPLPIISNNGISGVWSPTLNNNATTEYTFTPSTEQCASSAKMTIVVNAIPAAPIAADQQNWDNGDTVAELVAEGKGLKWYSSADAETALAADIVLVNGTYYVSQTENACESSRKTVTVSLILPVLGDDGIKGTENVKAFPNPFKDTFTVEINTETQEAARILIYDMLGKLIENRESTPGEILLQEFGRNYAMGIYNVVVNQSGITKIFRMIKG